MITIARPALAALLATAMVAACAQPMAVTRPATEADILVSVSGDEQRALWQAAIEGGTLPPVSAVEVPADPVDAVAAPVLAETGQPPAAPSIPEGVATAVVPVALPPAGFAGPARVVEVTPDRVILELGDGQQVAIAYRAPSRRAVGFLAAGQPATVEAAAVEPGSPVNQYAVAIGADSGPPVLIVLQEAGERPIRRDFKLAGASIRQVLNTAELRRLGRRPGEIPPSGTPVPVEFVIGDSAVVLAPGEVAGPAETGSIYEIVVYASAMYPPDEARADTPPFSLSVAVFAADIR